MTIVISSTDSYQDCWHPFFSLFHKFIYNIDDYKIYLITDNVKYTGHKFVKTIITSKNGQTIPWADRIKIGLNKIEENSFLFLMDDYFLRAPLNFSIFQLLNKIIESEQKVGGIRLVPNKNESKKNDFKILNKINKFSSYSASLQPTLWNKEFLKSILISGESPWQFELIGSLRLNFKRKIFFSISKDWINENGLIYDTLETGGIVKGKWLKSEYDRIENVLKIKIKSKRGFVDNEIQPNKYFRKLKLFKNVFFDLKVLLRNIKYIYKSILNKKNN